MFLFHPTTLLLIPAFLLGLYAQYKVKNAYKKYSKVGNEKRINGHDAAVYLLQQNGLTDVAVEEVAGELSDHYDPRDKTVRLSSANFQGSSLAAVSIAAHEVGHAIQHANSYKPLEIRTAILPVTNFGSMLYVPLFLAGLFFQVTSLMTLGIAFFAAVVLFQVITLPVEFDASKRAMKQLAGFGMLSSDEVVGAKKVLNAAALTYVAATIMAAAQLLQLFMLSGEE
ncbi:MAG: zinc metallopeptidase [Calditrichia bacterium]